MDLPWSHIVYAYVRLKMINNNSRKCIAAADDYFHAQFKYTALGPQECSPPSHTATRKSRLQFYYSSYSAHTNDVLKTEDIQSFRAY